MDRICGLKGTKSCKPRLLKGPLPPPRWTAGQVWRSLQRCFPAFATPGFSLSTPRTTTIWSASSSATRTTRTSMHSHRQWQGRARCVRIKVPTYNFLLEFYASTLNWSSEIRVTGSWLGSSLRLGIPRWICRWESTTCGPRDLDFLTNLLCFFNWI